MASLQSIDIGLTLLTILLVAVGVGIACWFLYWGPRARAFKSGQRRVPVWLGLGNLVLWNPGETFVFLQNKRVREVGDASGGLRTIFALRGDEAVGPIPLRTVLVNWEVPQVLTREAQPLEVKVGVWWKVGDPGTYAFRISDKAYQSSQSSRYGEVRDEVATPDWVKVLTESAVRSHINQLGVADVVSAQATRFLQETGEDSQGQRLTQSSAAFESAMGHALNEIRDKAKGYGIEVDRLEVQHVHLPPEIQQAINETRTAFLAPIRTEREAEAAKIKLQKLASVLGTDTVAMNMLMENLKGANFVTPINFLQSLFGGMDKKAAAAMASTSSTSTSAKKLPKAEDEQEKLPDS